ncbi:MAG TPA: YetF domain-containing protein [Terracidiphilus sp.]|jgi:uncharacterized membrane protein YcaP (DUF421 family)|nr:YetF domain-containing protein [Terracidiphilus sp.]
MNMAFLTIARAAFGYLFLVLMVRVVGRRPGKQLTPFEFVLVFYLGGLTLTGMVGLEMSLTNAVCQIFTIALCHYVLSWLRHRYPTAALILCGSPLILLKDGKWRTRTMSRMRIQDDDVMDVARGQGVRDLSEVDTVILEPAGMLSIVPRKSGQPEPTETAM